MTLQQSFLMMIITKILLLLSLTVQNNFVNSLVNCNEYQRSLKLDNLLRMDYVVYEKEDDDNKELYMKVQLVLEEDAAGSNSWIGFGIHQPGSLLMAPGEAIIGIPSATTTTAATASLAQRNNDNTNAHNVFKYSLGGYDQSMIQKFPTLQQTLEETEMIAENTTMTVLRFTKKLNEGDNELRIFSTKDEDEDQIINNFMWAYGFGTTLGYHRNRGSFAIQALSICDWNSTETGDDDEGGGDGFIELDVGQSYPELFAIHGILATIAWGVLSPLAIGSAMLRKYLTCLNGALWFKCHYYFNLLTFLFTLASFGIAVFAHQKSTPEGQNPKHFVAFAHATVGLIIMIFLLIQVFNGWFRPHPVSSNHDNTDETTANEEGHNDFIEKEEQRQQLLKSKKQRRSLWEYSHRMIGAALIGICWYQIHDGLTIYVKRYNGDDYRTMFWSITGALSGFILLFYICSSKPRIIVKQQGEDSDDDDDDDDQYHRNYPTNNNDDNNSTNNGNNATTNNNYIPGGTTNVELYDNDDNGIETKTYNRADSIQSC